MKTGQQILDLESLIVCDGMLDFGRITSISYHLMSCSSVVGDVVELGCHAGRTAAFMASLTTKRVWVYDSFEGLPSKSPGEKINDAMYPTGSLKASMDQVRQSFECATETNYKIIKGWFKDIGADQFPEHIAFAHIDGDLYQSTLDALRLVYPRLSFKAVCVIDDYANPNLQGVKEAVQTFMVDKRESTRITYGPKGMPNVQCFFVKE